MFASFLASAPQLGKLVLSGPGQYQLVFADQSKCSELRSVTLACGNDRAIYDLFCGLPNLAIADITLRDFKRGQTVVVKDNPLTHLCNSLTHLRLRDYSPERQDLTCNTPLATLVRRYRELRANTVHA